MAPAQVGLKVNVKIVPVMTVLSSVIPHLRFQTHCAVLPDLCFQTCEIVKIILINFSIVCTAVPLITGTVMFEEIMKARTDHGTVFIPFISQLSIGSGQQQRIIRNATLNFEVSWFSQSRINCNQADGEAYKQ